MKLKHNFIINEVAGQFVAVAVGDGSEDFNGFLKVNDIGSEILEILKDDVTLDQIISKMLEKHPDSTLEEATQTITEFVGRLKDEGLVD